MLGGLLRGTTQASGIWFGVHSNGTWGVWTATDEVGQPDKCISGLSGNVNAQANRWYTMRILINSTLISGWFDRNLVFSTDMTGKLPNSQGWAGMGTYTFDYAMFDNMIVEGSSTAPTPPATCNRPQAGMPLSMQSCHNETAMNQLWLYDTSNNQFRLQGSPSFCMNVGPNRAPDCIGSSTDGWLCQQVGVSCRK